MWNSTMWVTEILGNVMNIRKAKYDYIIQGVWDKIKYY